MAKISDKNIRLKVLQKFNYKCAYCGIDLINEKFHVDHIVPKMLGRPYKERESIDNYNPSCAPCNISKSTFDLEMWRTELELKILRIERDSSTFRNLKRFGLVGVIKNKVIFYFETI